MPVFIVGDSMLPSLRGGQIIGVNKLIYLLHPPRRGDVVAVWTDRELMIKRVLGLPGEEVAVRDGVFYVDGRPLVEPYVQFTDHVEIASGRIGSAQFVVAGDNRPQTLIAVVNQGRIVGRLMPSASHANQRNLHSRRQATTTRWGIRVPASLSSCGGEGRGKEAISHLGSCGETKTPMTDLVHSPRQV
jgi:signal peptidase I